ncbi:hypothetical protein [Vibrio cidicii]|uniref:hypothetical protein n=1 Tax=Vibrio cidicii TaxID=1763883 RepID=UPI0037048BD5
MRTRVGVNLHREVTAATVDGQRRFIYFYVVQVRGFVAVAQSHGLHTCLVIVAAVKAANSPVKQCA